MKILLHDPIVVSVSEPGETRWGYHQFPALFRRPDGLIGLMYADAADASETHGLPGPAFLTADNGVTWQPYRGEPTPIRPHYSLSEVGGGAWLTMPSAPYFDVAAAGVELPQPVTEANIYGRLFCYRLEDFPDVVRDYYRHIPGRRFEPGVGWRETAVDYDIDGLLPWKRERSSVLPRTYFERALLPWQGELMYADYRAQYVLRDGRVPARNTSSLLVSSDGGRSFRRRSTIAADANDRDLLGEPQLAPTADGRLACILRQTDHQQKPMAITWSADSGESWTPYQSLFEFGVWPCLQLMGNGAMVLSYGRPGVHLAIDPDGTGERWPLQQPLIAGDHGAIQHHSCGYTSLLPIADDTLLIAYSDFRHPLPAGGVAKAIVVRAVQLSG